MAKSLLQTIELIPLDIFCWSERVGNGAYIFLIDKKRAEISEVDNKGKNVREFKTKHDYSLHKRIVSRYVLPSELGRLSFYLRFKLQQLPIEA